MSQYLQQEDLCWSLFILKLTFRSGYLLKRDSYVSYAKALANFLIGFLKKNASVVHIFDYCNQFWLQSYIFVCFGSFWTTIVHDLFNVIFNVLVASVALI